MKLHVLIVFRNICTAIPFLFRLGITDLKSDLDGVDVPHVSVAPHPALMLRLTCVGYGSNSII